MFIADYLFESRRDEAGFAKMFCKFICVNMLAKLDS